MRKLIITGTKAEKQLCKQIADAAGEFALNSAGMFKLAEFIALIDCAALLNIYKAPALIL